MPLKLKVYIGIVAGLAISLFIYLVSSLPLPSNIWPVLIFFVVITTIAEFLPVDLPTSGSVTIGFPIDFVVILVYGPATAMFITIFGAIVGELMQRKITWYKILFNASQYALSAGIAGIAYQEFGGIVGAPDITNYIIPAIACALVYYLVNS